MLRRLLEGAAVCALIGLGSTFFVREMSSLGRLGAGGAPLVVRFIGAIVLIIAIGGLGGWIAARLGQPQVIGEMAAGVALGPSLLGAFAPTAEHWLFPPALLPPLNLIAQLAVIVFIFLVGADLSLDLLSGARHQVIVLGVGMIVLPVGCGILLAGGLAGHYRPDGVPAISFLLFVGLATGITAFPVLARILTELGLHSVRIGVLALAAAGISDVIAWCLLVLATTSAKHGSADVVLRTVGLLLIFAIVTWLVLRPVLHQFIAIAEQRPQGQTRARPSAVLLLVFAICGAFITDRIGVHPIFGAFLIGLALPRGSALVQQLTRGIERGVQLVIPLFFAVVGLKVQLGVLSRGQDLLVAGLILVVAVLSKLAGTALIARLTGLAWRESVGFGVMVNCRGLTELVVLTTGLSLGIIGQRLFVILVLMTFVTTTMTCPLLKRLHLAGTPQLTETA